MTDTDASLPLPREIPDEPPEELRFHREGALTSAPGEIWRARLLIRALAERELRALYKQAALGVAWAVLAPVTLMIVFTIVFQRVADINTRGVPYALFSYIGLVPWNFFAGSVTTGGMSLVNQMTLVNKLNCPREVFPLAYVVVTAVNTIIATGVLIILFAVNGYAPRLTTPLAIVPLVVMILFTIAVTLFVSSITVYLRDLRHALPILLQLGLFATPVVYGMDAIPTPLQPWYALANPMAAIIDSFRQTVLFGNAPNWTLLGLATVTTLVLLVSGLKLFRRLEMGFADVA
jgi:ABC-2 type transport system permease protein/lipopolysaccharide transport system permease protein